MPKFEKGHRINLGRVPWNKIPKQMALDMPLPTHEEVLWAAGFWEGEGSLTTRSVTASQVNVWPLERLQAIFGGSLNLRKVARPTQRPCYQWFLCGEAARLFVHLLYPHLSPRRRAQIDAKFITQEKRQRHRASLKPLHQYLAEHRGRNEEGQFTNAKIS